MKRGKSSALRWTARTSDLALLLAFSATLFYWAGVDDNVIGALTPDGHFRLELGPIKLGFFVKRY